MQTSVTACPAVREIPGRSEAEEALAAALSGGRRSFWFAVVFLPDHISTILDSGDYGTADRVFLSFCQRLAVTLPPSARFFRWSGSAVVALMEHHGGAEQARFEIGTMTLGAERDVFSLVEMSSLEALRREIDIFVAKSL